ncbi:MAG: hydrogenase expression protein HypA/HybF [Synergistaceae bacterium]|nr:hydrogenase expression protein HypA/HybF [Synergistaceae bacterium]
MAKFRCLECKKEFELDPSSSTTRRCPECRSKALELISGEIPRGKSWSSKSYSAR